MRGAESGQPAGGFRAERPGAAGHDGGVAGLPADGRGAVQGGADQASQEGAGRPYGELVLASIPIEEHERRVKEMTDRQRRLALDGDEAYFERIDGLGKGIRPVREQLGETLSKKEFHGRGGKPFVSMSRPAS